MDHTPVKVGAWMRVKMFVWSVPLYASETRCLTAEDIQRIKAIEM